MRIQSPFHDYYDGALGHGADPSIFYLRTPRLAETMGPATSLRRTWSDPKGVGGLPDGFMSENGVGNYGADHEIMVSPIYTALSGQWQVSWSCRLFRTDRCYSSGYRSDEEVKAARAVHHTAADTKTWILAQAEVHGLMKQGHAGPRLRRLLDAVERAEARAAESESFALDLNRRYRSPAVVVASPVEMVALEEERDKLGRPVIMGMVAPPTLDGRGLFQANHHVFVDIPLRIFDLQRAVDPYQAFQRIAQCLGGVLAQEGRPMVEISDQSLLSKHGFDPRYGFRHRP